MKTVEKSVLIWFTAQEMFDLVVDVASYPQFLPWCDQTHILNLEEQGMTARIGMAFGGLEVLTERLGGIGSKAGTEALTQAVRQTAGQMLKKAGKAVGSEAFEEVLAGRYQA